MPPAQETRRNWASFREEWKMQNHTADTCENKTHPEPTLTMIDVRCAEGEITSLKLRIRCTA
jgi:hypothetical protein